MNQPSAACRSDRDAAVWSAMTMTCRKVAHHDNYPPRGPSLRRADCGAGPGHVALCRTFRATGRRDRRPPARARSRHDADRHRRNVRQRRSGDPGGRSDRRAPRRSVPGGQGAANPREPGRYRAGLQGQPRAAQHRLHRSLPAALAGQRPARRDGRGFRRPGGRRANPPLGGEQPRPRRHRRADRHRQGVCRADRDARRG